MKIKIVSNTETSFCGISSLSSSSCSFVLRLICFLLSFFLLLILSLFPPFLYAVKKLLYFDRNSISVSIFVLKFSFYYFANFLVSFFFFSLVFHFNTNVVTYFPLNHSSYQTQKILYEKYLQLLTIGLRK